MITFLPVGLALWGVYTACWVALAAVRRWRVRWRQACAHHALFLYALLIVDVTLFPIPLHGAPSWPEIDLTPWKTLRTDILNAHASAWRPLVGSALLFAPLGGALPALYASMRRLSLVMMVSFFAASSIQMARLLISARMGIAYRAFEVDDIFFNCLGAALGFGLWRAASARIRARRPTSATLKAMGHMRRREERVTSISGSRAKSP